MVVVPISTPGPPLSACPERIFNVPFEEVGPTAEENGSGGNARPKGLWFAKFN
jgi:hypothetical protein